MRMVALAALGTLAACNGGEGASRAPAYEGIETRLMDGDLVNFRVAMRGARDRAQVADYAACAAAQYALIRGYGFARHVRTAVDQTGSLWRGDAVYVISPTLPRGVATIDAEVTVRDCGARGIPTV
ncbi:MAG: hypothetical protein ACK4OP_01670 [Gemmobacter sp.]